MKKKVGLLFAVSALLLMLCGCDEKSGFLQKFTEANNAVNDFVWVKIGLILLLGTGIIMTCVTKWFQISHIGHWLKNTIGSVFKKHVSGHTKDQLRELPPPSFRAVPERFSGCGLPPFSA